MTTTTTRFGILRPVTTDPAAGAPTTGLTKYLTSPTDRLEAVGAIYSQGTLAARPAAAKAGLLYVATDVGALYYDTGSAWLLFAMIPAAVSLAGPFTLATGGWTAISASVFHIAVAGVWRFTLSADFVNSAAGSALTAGIDLDVLSGATHYRNPGTGDQLQARTTGSATDFISASKQIYVTTSGSANVDVYGFGAATTKAQNIKLYGELIG